MYVGVVCSGLLDHAAKFCVAVGPHLEEEEEEKEGEEKEEVTMVKRPQTAQTTMDRLTLPVAASTPVGETKMPLQRPT